MNEQEIFKFFPETVFKYKLEDFKNLNKVQCTTIRVKKGIFKNVKVKKLHDAKYICNDLRNVDKIISKLKAF